MTQQMDLETALAKLDAGLPDEEWLAQLGAFLGLEKAEVMAELERINGNGQEGL